MKKSRFFEDQMAKILREADTAGCCNLRPTPELLPALTGRETTLREDD